MLFLSVNERKYYGIIQDQVVCIIERGTNTTKWIAKDLVGITLLEPNTFRTDLFEELEVSFEELE